MSKSKATIDKQFKLTLARSIMDNPDYNREKMGDSETLSEAQVYRLGDLFYSWIDKAGRGLGDTYVIPRLLFRNTVMKDPKLGADVDISNMLFDEFCALSRGFDKRSDELDKYMCELVQEFSSIKINIDYVVHSKGELVNGYITMPFNELIKYKADESLSLSKTFNRAIIDRNATIGDLYDIFMRDTWKIPELNLSSHDITMLYNIFSKIFNMPVPLGGFALFSDRIMSRKPEDMLKYGACNCWAKVISEIGPQHAMRLHKALFEDIEGDRVYLSRNITKKNIVRPSEKKK